MNQHVKRVTGRNLSKEVAVVTGASEGIGRAMDSELTRLGADITMRFAHSQSDVGQVAARFANLVADAPVRGAGVRLSVCALTRGSSQTVANLGRFAIEKGGSRKWDHAHSYFF